MCSTPRGARRSWAWRRRHGTRSAAAPLSSDNRLGVRQDLDMRLIGLVLGATVLGWLAWTMPATAFPDPIGGCIGSGCPAEPYPPPSNGDFIGTDEAINVFVGGSMNV